MNNLTNTDISNKIRALREIKDPCDRAVALVEFESDYKQSQFYKLTKRPLRDLYYEITIEDLLSLRTVLVNLQQFLNELDTEKLTSMFDDINAESLKTIREGLNEFNASGFEDLLHGIKH